MKVNSIKRIFGIARNDIDIWFFFAFLVALPFSIRKVLWFEPLRGAFNEYADVSLYVSDVFLLGALCLWIIKLYNNKCIKSTNLICSTWNISRILTADVLVAILPAVFILWAASSIFRAAEPFIALFSVLKLFELYGLYLYIIFRFVPHETNSGKETNFLLKTLLKIIMFSGVLEAVIGIFQFLHQHSLGFFFLRESEISSSLPGVAKVIIDNEPYIRAYGLFPHPNMLGGFLLVSLIMTHLYFRMFHMEHGRDVLRKIIVGVQWVGLLLTFSKSAILGYILALLYIGIVSRGTSIEINKLKAKIYKFSEKSLFVRWRNWRAFLAVIFGTMLFVSLFRMDVDALFFKSLREREIYQSIALDIVHNQTILGISCGQLVIFMAKQHIYPLFDWQLQPVHNVFLLVWAELGVVGFFMFSLWYLLLVWGVFLKTKVSRMGDFIRISYSFGSLSQSFGGVYFRAIMIGFLPPLVFDHYLWDIQQGQCLLWLVSGLLFGVILHNKRFI